MYQRGFSLLEVLIALSLLIFMLTTLMRFYMDAFVREQMAFQATSKIISHDA